jgi:hypothetical protein
MLLECVALGDILDFVAPFNISMIPNNSFTKYFFKNLAGKSISNKILNAFMRFSFEDSP